jgi:hypothetical protein
MERIHKKIIAKKGGGVNCRFFRPTEKGDITLQVG